MGLVAIAVTALAAPGAQAAKRVGSSLGVEPNAVVCPPTTGPATHACTDAIVGLDPADAAPFGVAVPTAGIVTSWRIRRGADGFPVQAALRVIRGATAAGTSAEVTLPAAAGTYAFATRLAVGPGDRFGVDLRNVPFASGVTVARSPAPSADVLSEWMPPLLDGASTSPYKENTPGVQLLINADVEQDADRDGFGDETQDACPTIPTTQQDCAIGAPQTTITRKPKRKTTKRKAKIAFVSNAAAATFECSLDGFAYNPCTSPFKVKRLSRGEHFVLVRATVNQIPDPTPAKATFTVIKKKRRR